MKKRFSMKEFLIFTLNKIMKQGNMVLEIICRIWNKRWILRSILYTIYFNFKMLKIGDAIKLPVILYKSTYSGG